MEIISAARIEKIIYLIRGKKVMLDSDLAVLYQVETRYLNRQVKRNQDRFPEDFMFQLSKKETDQFRESSPFFQNSTKGRKYLPYVFTEHGIVALAGVINSKTAISVNISIVRTFVKIRHLLAHDQSLLDKLNQIEKGTEQMFRIVFERLDFLEGETPILPPRRKRIGIVDKR